MARIRKLTDTQIDEMCELRERGWGYVRLAQRYRVSPGAMHYQCLKNGAVSPRQRQQPVPTEPCSFVAADGRTQRRFTVADDAQLLALEATGMAYRLIAQQIGRPLTSVRIRLMMIALRDDLPAQAVPA